MARMTSRLSALTMAGLCCCAVSAAAQQVIAPASLPARIVRSERRVEVAPDGSSIIMSHIESKMLLQNAIAVLGQPAIGYSDLLQQVDITDAYTLKADGSKIAVKPDAIIIQQSPSSRNSPLLSDQKQKVILFPNVEVGDTLVYDIKTTSKPQIAGSFTYDTVIPAAVAVDDGKIVISVPKSMPAAIDARGLNAEKSADGDRILYSVSYSNFKPTMPLQTQAEYDLSPRFSLSTFKDYDTLADTYSALIRPVMAVTPAIQAKADEITAGTSDRREQARKIYDWVSLHVRYVALEFGRGGIIPHNPDDVLTNAYGDCKDHAVLFAALLKAKGIDSNLVLINAASIFTVAKVASLAPFNHMIVWLPEFHLYADTTNGRVVSFGLLPLPEYGKPVLHIGDKGSALHHVPVNDPAISGTAYKLVLVADDAGRITSSSSITATGDFATTLRLFGTLMQGQDGSVIAGNILKKSPNPRATGILTAPPPDAEAASYQISSSYSTPGVINGLAQNVGMQMADSLRIAGPFSGVFFGPIFEGKYRDADAVPCYNGHAVDDETLQFSSARHLTKLPDDTRLSRAHVTYTSHWTTDGNSVSVHREFSTRFDQPLCSGAAKDELVSAADQIKKDTEMLIPVQRIDATAAPANAPPSTTPPATTLP